MGGGKVIICYKRDQKNGGECSYPDEGTHGTYIWVLKKLQKLKIQKWEENGEKRLREVHTTSSNLKNDIFQGEKAKELRAERITNTQKIRQRNTPVPQRDIQSP